MIPPALSPALVTASPAHTLAAWLHFGGLGAFGPALSLCLVGFIVWRLVVAITAPDQPPRS